MEAQEQAKQLDSVTDRFDEKEVDATKAQEAVSALSSSKQAQQLATKDACVSKEDVDLIVSELEVTEEAAEKALREAACEVKDNGERMVVAALKKLVTT
jgi:NACalpha-BTF3-like transcription factor